MTWRLQSNARLVIAQACKPRKGVKQLSLPGADKACGTQGFTGLCVTPPKGEDRKDWCLWDVKISFLNGRATGSLELTSLKIYSLNNLKNVLRVRAEDAQALGLGRRLNTGFIPAAYRKVVRRAV